MQARILSSEASNNMILESLIGGGFIVKAPEAATERPRAEMKIVEGFTFGKGEEDTGTTPSPMSKGRGREKSIEALEAMRRSSASKEEKHADSECGESWVTGGEASQAGSVRPSTGPSRRPTNTVPSWMQPAEDTQEKDATSLKASPPPKVPREVSPLPNLYPDESEEVMREKAARDLEEYTAMIQNLWLDLKKWRQETKTVRPEDGKGGPLLLALRHMGYQIETHNAISSLQMRVATRLSSLALTATEELPAHGPLATALRGERWVLGRATSIASTRMHNEVEDGYGDTTPVRAESLRGVTMTEEGEMVMSVDALVKNIMPTEVARDMEHKRREMADEVASLAKMVTDIKRREMETRDIHQSRVAQLMKTVQALEGERDALIAAQDANRQKTEIYTEAFDEYRKNCNDLRERCQVLTKENYELRKALQQSQGSTFSYMQQTATPAEPTLDILLSPTPTRTPHTRRTSMPVQAEQSPIDLEYEALSQSVESGLKGLGKFVSPEIHTIESITPEYKTDSTPTRLRSLSPWRYLPPTPQQRPPDYSPAAGIPPFVKDFEPPPS
eukprot:TRINITY_DN25848_c0_g1_i1.p1 TRINITY_DN25848_c0_g1~~TRINITY_DN25848_c0_g1_i1.p1  ORF type:complete len:561 (+),score=191.32 TRINITY_DN25848_c0_g1_i1:866-2548(+)